jgi:hypothetical protein
MQVSSHETQSILAILRQTALEKRSKDKSGSGAEVTMQSSTPSSGKKFNHDYSSFQSALASTDIDTSTAAASVTATSVGMNFSGLMSAPSRCHTLTSSRRRPA